MQSLKDLRAQRAAKAKEARKLLDDHPKEKWTTAVAEQSEAQYREIEALDEMIAARVRQNDLDAESNPARKDWKPEDLDPMSPKALFDKFLRAGWEGLSTEEIHHIRNTMSTTTGSEGGFTVPSLISAKLYDQMKAFGAMRQVAEVIPTVDGKPLSFPGSDGTAEVGEIIAQNVTATALDPSFSTVSLNVFKYSSKIVAVPFELLQDSIIDVEAFVRRRLAQRLGRIGNQHFTTGTGTTQPDGIVPRATSGKVGTTGQTLTIIYDDLVDLVHAVDPAYRGAGCAFMTNDALLRVLRKLKDTAGRPLWMPSYDQGIRMGPNNATPHTPGDGGYESPEKASIFDYLLGYPVIVNNDMAVPAANAKSLVFGDMSYYKVRDAMDVQLFRFTDSAYTKLGQIAFLAWARMGGNLVDTSAVKFYQHSAT